MKRCIGYGETEGKCQNLTGKASRTGRENPYWCPECDEKRIEAISAGMDAIMARFKEARDAD